MLICAHHYFSLDGGGARALAAFFLIFFFVIWRLQPPGSVQNYAKINGTTTHILQKLILLCPEENERKPNKLKKLRCGVYIQSRAGLIEVFAG